MELSTLIKEKYSVPRIAQILGRSPKSIDHAIRNMMFQQLMHHSKEDVAWMYNLTLDELKETIVPSKFYIPITSSFDLGSYATFLKTFFVLGGAYYAYVLSQQMSLLQ